MQKYLRYSLAAVLAVLSAILFFAILNYPANGVLKFFAAVGALGLPGGAIQKLLKIEGEWGLMLVRTTNGLKLMERLAKRHPKFWRAFADFGLVFGFGALSAYMYKGIDRRVYFGTLALLLVSTFLMLPLILPVAFSVISGLATGTATSASGRTYAGISVLQIAFTLLLLVGGVTIAGILSILANSAAILAAIISFIGNTGGGALQRAAPGATALIPGQNIPLFEGLIALIVILVVHEGAHGILARLHKIKLKSAGVVLFGILPVGAFVDPDEKTLQKSASLKQRDVLVAGSTANFATSIAAFLLLIAFIYATAPVQDNRVFISGVADGVNIPTGAILQKVNGVQINSIYDLVKAKDKIAPLSAVVVETDKGTYSVKTNDNSAIGIFLTSVSGRPFLPLPFAWGLYVYSNSFVAGYGWLSFIYTVLALIFVLNFLIGSVNMMPIPVFDGQRLISLAVPHKLAMRIITYAVAAAFIINLLPWLWH